MLPRQNLAELRSLRKDSTACVITVLPIDISRQKSTVAAHRRKTSAPYAGSFFSYVTLYSVYRKDAERETLQEIHK